MFFFRIAAAILVICFTLFGLTACAGTTDSKDNNDDNALLQGTWEIDTGSGAGYKFVDDKFMWLKSIENVNDNYWYCLLYTSIQQRSASLLPYYHLNVL